MTEPFGIEETARNALIDLSGDARRLLTYLELAADSTGANKITVSDVEHAVEKEKAAGYDNKGDTFYDPISAFP